MTNTTTNTNLKLNNTVNKITEMIDEVPDAYKVLTVTAVALAVTAVDEDGQIKAGHKKIVSIAGIALAGQLAFQAKRALGRWADS